MREVDLSLNQPDQDKSNGANREMRNDMLFCPDENGPCIKGAFHDMELFFNFHKIAVGVEYFHIIHIDFGSCNGIVSKQFTVLAKFVHVQQSGQIGRCDDFTGFFVDNTFVQILFNERDLCGF